MAFFNYYDATLFGTGDPDINNWLELHKDELLASEELLGFRCGNSDQVEVDICVMPLTNAIKSDPGNEELSFRECPAGWNEFNVVITLVYPCDGTNPAIGLPSIFPQGAAGWWPDPNTIITPDPQDPNAGNPALANPGLNNLGIPNLQAFFEACATQGEPGSAGNNAEVASLCDQISAVTGDIPLGSAELAWLLGEGHSDVLNFFAMWAPNQTSPASLEMAAEVIQMYAAGVLDISKGFNSFSFVKARNLMLELGLNGEQGAYLFAHPELLAEIEVFYEEIEQNNSGETELKAAKLASKLVIDSDKAGIGNSTDYEDYEPILSRYASEFPLIDDEAAWGLSDPAYIFLYTLEYTLLKKDHPGWSNLKLQAVAHWNTTLFQVHAAADILGLIPAAGEPADAINGVLYVMEGDLKSASYSLAATLPFVGWVSTSNKWAGYIVKYQNKLHNLTFAVKNSVITFGQRSKLRKVLNIVDNNLEAHHVIPWNKKEHPLVQIAAKGKQADYPWHMNHPNTGLPVTKYRTGTNPDGVHANHPQYDNYIGGRLDDILGDLIDEFGNIDNIPFNIASQKLRDLSEEIKEVITSNPTIKINDLFN
ncbi:MAG: hypothetical protein H6562_01830 [Lewinellaceae bacterium]|nr:hypothetical protein [Lewinellaceae bacterium]